VTPQEYRTNDRQGRVHQDGHTSNRLAAFER
jgi:hypothetical protein